MYCNQKSYLVLQRCIGFVILPSIMLWTKNTVMITFQILCFWDRMLEVSLKHLFDNILFVKKFKLPHPIETTKQEPGGHSYSFSPASLAGAEKVEEDRWARWQPRCWSSWDCCGTPAAPGSSHLPASRTWTLRRARRTSGPRWRAGRSAAAQTSTDGL